MFSALLPITDMRRLHRHVGSVPNSDMAFGARPMRPMNGVAARLNKRDRCRAVFRVQPPVTDTPRSRSRKSQLSGLDDIAPDRGCPAQSATDRNTATSAH